MNYYAFLTFAKVFEKENMTIASKDLHISQPCLTLQVKALETQYHVRLFDRTPKGVKPTNAGRVLYQYIKDIINLNQELENQMMKLSQHAAGQIKIGATETFAAYIMPYIFGAFREKFPNVQLYMSVKNSNSIITDLLSYNLDLGILPLRTNNKQVVEEAFVLDELIFIASKEHPWAERTSIKVQELPEVNFLAREEGSHTREILSEFLQKNHVNPVSLNYSAVLGSNEAIKGAVEQNLGISVISRFSVRKELESGLLVELPMKEKLCRNFYFAYRKESIVSEAIKLFIGCCKELYPDAAGSN